MKQLVFIRHAKSSWETNAQDHDRPLMDKGIKRAKTLSKALKKTFDLSNFLWYSSTANRAMSTAKIFQKEFSVTIQPKKEIYTFSGKELLQIIHNFHNSEDKIVLFGHNPAFTELVNQLGTLKVENLPTSGIVIIEFDTNNWKEVAKGITLHYISSKKYLCPKNTSIEK